MQRSTAIYNRFRAMMLEEGTPEEDIKHFANRWIVRMRRRGREFQLTFD
jgi:hypothetical protein